MERIEKYIEALEELKPGYEVTAVYELKSGYVFFIVKEGVDDYLGGTTIPYLNKRAGKIEAKTMYDVADEWPGRKLIYSK